MAQGLRAGAGRHLDGGCSQQGHGDGAHGGVEGTGGQAAGQFSFDGGGHQCGGAGVKAQPVQDQPVDVNVNVHGAPPPVSTQSRRR